MITNFYTALFGFIWEFVTNPPVFYFLLGIILGGLLFLGRELWIGSKTKDTDLWLEGEPRD